MYVSLLLRMKCRCKCGWNLNKDLLRTSRTRYTSHPLVLYFSISLSYWKWINFWCHTVCCGLTQSIGSFLRNKIDESTGDFPFCWGLGAWCAWIALCFSLFMCHVQKCVIPLVSCWSNLSLSLPFYYLPLVICMSWEV